MLVAHQDVLLTVAGVEDALGLDNHVPDNEVGGVPRRPRRQRVRDHLRLIGVPDAAGGEVISDALFQTAAKWLTG